MFGKLKTEKEILERQVASLESTKARLNAETNELNERLKLLRDSIETQEVLSDFGIKTIIPNTRVRELSSSSLPEPFALNAYCFCDDAFDIESKMHAHFDSKRVSPNREFFYITVEEAVDALKNIYGQEVRYGNKDLEELEENNEKI